MEGKEKRDMTWKHQKLIGGHQSHIISHIKKILFYFKSSLEKKYYFGQSRSMEAQNQVKF